MRIGFFGGSFDPPHRAHLAAAQAAQAAFALDRVLLAPVAAQPLKPRGAVAGYADRLAMTELLCADQSGLEASDLDRPRSDGAPNFTVDTLTTLLGSASPSTEIFVIVGADAFAGLREWRDPDRLLALAQWIIISRPGVSTAQLDAIPQNTAQCARIHRLEVLDDPVSASELRTRLRGGQDCSAFVPASVVDYIYHHHLYGV